jgi:PrtD family type I secretion system ABC transporter
MAATKFTRMFIQSLALGVGAYLAIKNEITPGAMIAATIILARALAPIELAIGQWKSFLACRTAYARIQALFESVPGDEDKVKLPQPRGAVTLEAVTAAPPGTQQIVLRNLSFAIPAGETVAVVGPSAAGKSSLARLLVGVWQPAAGSVRLDGADLRHWDQIQLGAHLGYLPQDVELFSGSIADNISRFTDGDAEQVIAAAKLAGVHDMIQNLPGGYNTQIGEGGHALSGGQRQRIGLARALYGDPALLVLDEPNASLDQEGEQALMEAIQHMRQKRRTIVLVTHKSNILAAVDKILALNQGQLMMYGPRDEVLQKLMGPRVVPKQPGAAPAPVAGPPQQAAAG